MLETIGETTVLASLPPRPSQKMVFEGAQIKTDANYGDDQDPSQNDSEEYAKYYTASQARKASQQKKDVTASPTSDTSEQESAFVFNMTAGQEPLYGDPGEDGSYDDCSDYSE